MLFVCLNLLTSEFLQTETHFSETIKSLRQVIEMKLNTFNMYSKAQSLDRNHNLAEELAQSV